MNDILNIVFPSRRLDMTEAVDMVSAISNTYIVSICLEGDLVDNQNMVDTLIKLKAEPRGPLCKCIMAVDFIDNEHEVLICEGKLLPKERMKEAVDVFRSKNVDCGVVTCAESASAYVALVNDDIIEAAEGRKISEQGIVGIYYFKSGHEFVEAAKNAIRKGCSYDGKYYISSAINEMILKNKSIKAFCF